MESRKSDEQNNSFEVALNNLRACQNCAARLPLGANPIVQLSPQAKILIVGQAPGTKAHHSKLTFNDPSGDRLRQWLNVTRDQFYNDKRIAIMSMGFCYPGRNPRGGDLPPLQACAPLWHRRMLNFLPNINLILLVGQYAQAYYLGNRRKRTLAETVHAWREYLPTYFPLPHPSWRNTAWCQANPWFEVEVIPELQARVRELLKL